MDDLPAVLRLIGKRRHPALDGKTYELKGKDFPTIPRTVRCPPEEHQLAGTSGRRDYESERL